jgi:hypothetical protein
MMTEKTEKTESLREKLSSDTLRDAVISERHSEVAEAEFEKLELGQDLKKVPTEVVYITGLKLYGMLAAITLVIFLMFLDLSIVATVSVILKLSATFNNLLGYSKNH